jgi:hypothetical protein
MGWGDEDVERACKRLAGLVARLPGIEVHEEHGHTGYLVRGKRIGWLLVDHHGDGRLALWVKAPPGEQESLVGGDPRRFFVPPYLGHRGWVGVQVDPGADPDWDEVAALLEQSWRMTAGKRAIAAFDASPSGEVR